MVTGNVKWFDARKGFGFIVSPEGKDVFVHFTSIQGNGYRCLHDGEPVEYEIIEGDKGLHAQKVRRLELQVPRRQPATQRVEMTRRRPGSVPLHQLMHA